ncbi:hypothetical protein Bca101_014323 [Brassica carinata]
MLSCPYALTLWSEIRLRLPCVRPMFSAWSDLIHWACTSSSATPSVLKMLVLQTLVYSVSRQLNNLLHN